LDAFFALAKNRARFGFTLAEYFRRRDALQPCPRLFNLRFDARHTRLSESVTAMHQSTRIQIGRSIRVRCAADEHMARQYQSRQL
jgi:hypothetical protein